MINPRVDEKALKAIEARYSAGLRSPELLRVLLELGVQLSEATLRKYIQLGLLPRSVRIGRKGKHLGSSGVYPVTAVRQIVRIKELLAQGYTIEQIQSDFLLIRNEIHDLQRILGGLFDKLGGVLKKREGQRQTLAVTVEIDGAKALARELVSCLLGVEKRLTTPSHLRSVSVS